MSRIRSVRRRNRLKTQIAWHSSQPVSFSYFLCCILCCHVSQISTLSFQVNIDETKLTKTMINGQGSTFPRPVVEQSVLICPQPQSKRRLTTSYLTHHPRTMLLCWNMILEMNESVHSISDQIRAVADLVRRLRNRK